MLSNQEKFELIFRSLFVDQPIVLVHSHGMESIRFASKRLIVQAWVLTISHKLAQAFEQLRVDLLRKSYQ